MAWALAVQNSKDIIVFGEQASRLTHRNISDELCTGAGLYSFFQAFDQTCLDSNSCQDQLVTIDTASTISVYSLSTVGVSNQLSVGNQAVIPASQNVNGFQVRIHFLVVHLYLWWPVRTPSRPGRQRKTEIA